MAKIVDQIVVQTNGVLDELHIFHNVCTIALLTLFAFDGDTTLRFVDFAEALLDVVHRCHHVRHFLVFLRYNLLQRVSCRKFGYSLFLFFVVARKEKGGANYRK